MKIGTRVIVSERVAGTWGYQTPCKGTVIGKDPKGYSDRVYAVRIDECENCLFETSGVHKANLEVISSMEWVDQDKDGRVLYSKDKRMFIVRHKTEHGLDYVFFYEGKKILGHEQSEEAAKRIAEEYLESNEHQRLGLTS